MTKREKIIVSAYTGYLMCGIDELKDYIEEKLNRPIMTHELGDKLNWEDIREAVKSDFLELCK